jgi:hypothetical protein
MSPKRSVCATAAAVLALVLLGGCGSVRAASQEAEPCFVSRVYDYAAEGVGEATPAAALLTMADGIEAALEKELTTVPDTPERARVHANDRAAAAALRSLKEPAEQDPEAGTWELRDPDGTVTAQVAVEEAPDGGWRIGTLGHVAPPEECETAAERAEREN